VQAALSLELQRQCPICGGADQHEKDCILEGKKHVYIAGDMSRVDWSGTLTLNPPPQHHAADHQRDHRKSDQANLQRR
jgi:hypothetical protein